MTLSCTSKRYTYSALSLAESVGSNCTTLAARGIVHAGLQRGLEEFSFVLELLHLPRWVFGLPGRGGRFMTLPAWRSNAWPRTRTFESRWMMESGSRAGRRTSV